MLISQSNFLNDGFNGVITCQFAVSLAAIAVGLCAVKQESRLFNGCVETVVAEGRSQAEAVRYCNGG